MLFILHLAWHLQVLQIGKFSLRKNFHRSPSTTKIKEANYFLGQINGVSLFRRVVIATKIKPGKNLTAEIFYQRKIPHLRTVCQGCMLLCHHRWVIHALLMTIYAVLICIPYLCHFLICIPYLCCFDPYSGYFSNQIKFQTAMLCKKIKRPENYFSTKIIAQRKKRDRLQQIKST